MRSFPHGIEHRAMRSEVPMTALSEVLIRGQTIMRELASNTILRRTIVTFCNEMYGEA
jgi:hypothetical protein